MANPEPSKQERSAELPSPTLRVRAHVAGLKDVRGAMRIHVRGKPLASLLIDDGEVEYLPGVEQGDVSADFNDVNDTRSLLLGKLNPVVAGLQRRVLLSGNVPLGARIILGLRTGPTFNPSQEAEAK